MTTNRPLRVFLCHSSNDKPAVRELYQKLRAEAWIQPWLDEEEIFPGMDWNMEIEKAVEAADAIIVCLTKNSISKEGYVQRELRIVLDFADYKPEGTLYIMPVRLEECEPPRRLRAWQYADYFEGQRDRALQRLLVSLKKRATSLELKYKTPVSEKEEKSTQVVTPKIITLTSNDLVLSNNVLTPKFIPISNNLNLTSGIGIPNLTPINLNKLTLSNGMEFMRVPAGKFLMGSDNGDIDEKPQHTVNIHYDYWMARFPVTNELYNAYVVAKEIEHPLDEWREKKDHPVGRVNWADVMIYCQWANEVLKSELPGGLILRLPTEAEWEKAARSVDAREYPWGNKFENARCNCNEATNFFSKFTNAFTHDTTSVNIFSPQGDSPYGCADMVGNVLEWTHSLYKGYPYKDNDGRENEFSSEYRVQRGGSLGFGGLVDPRCANRSEDDAVVLYYTLGFRICLAPPLPK